MLNFHMERFGRISTLSLFLTVSSFVVGVLPLSFALSSKRKHQLSTFGHGLLLGAALGVIIPEGIESISSVSSGTPVSIIALSLLIGLAFMLIVEQYLVPHSLSISPSDSRGSYHISTAGETVEFDMRPMNAEVSAASRRDDTTSENIRNTSLNQRIVAYPLTLGLVIHSLADGLALGASAASEDFSDTSMSFVVFLTLVIHKSPAALALTSSLLSTSLSRSEIRKHVAFFSIATPIGAICSFSLLVSLGAGAGNWTGIALLVSGGTFLYVATIIQPASAHSHGHADSSSAEEVSKLQRVVLSVSGIFLPFTLGSLFGHAHVHVHQ